MDEWTTLDHVNLSTVTTSEAELAAVVTESGGRTRNQKRKADEVHEEEEHHAEFDQNALREHEEFTKVKNVERIELGRYEMETWYFSPLPQEYNMCKVYSSTYMQLVSSARLLHCNMCMTCNNSYLSSGRVRHRDGGRGVSESVGWRAVGLEI